MMLGLTPVQTTPPYVAPPYVPPTQGIGSDQYLVFWSQSLNKDFPNAVEGDGVIYISPADGPEVWVKVGSGWNLGYEPGTVPPMTMEYRPTAKRIIFDAFSRGDPRLVGTNIGTGNLALIGLLGFLLLRGAIK